ncbi:hypothetical protein MUK42_04617 [Musa troglodytarum]|uniref:60S ribosomal protein L36 n=1 Tax=Musa troglodytarum TaxID=320322 RepID=A0A9E7GFV0_9LILI|nr:hypothetical protein MUK42_04617 [Musa troglodytarum]
MALPQPNTGIFVGLNKGHIVTKREFSPSDLPAEKGQHDLKVAKRMLGTRERAKEEMADVLRIQKMNERMPQREKPTKPYA